MTSPPPGEASSPPPPSPRSPSSRLTSLIIPSLDRIIKSSSRKHSKLASQCKSLIENFPSPHLTPFSPTSPHSSLSGPLDDYSIADSELILSPLLVAASSGFLKIANPALDCLKNLIAHGHLHGEVDSDSESPPDVKLLLRVIESVCKCVEHGDDAVELLVLRTLLLAVNSTTLRIHGDCLLRIVRTCYDLCLGSKTTVNQTTAKASLIQILVIVFGRMEADSSTVPVQPIVVAELMEPVEKEGGPAQVDVNMLQFVQGFVTKIINGIDVMLNPGKPRGGGGWAMHDGTFSSTAVGNTNPTDLLDSTDRDMLDAKCWEISMYKTALEGRKGELEVDGEGDEDLGLQIGSKMRTDAFLVFRALCKLSMKSSPKELLSDPAQMRGKIVALELLKILLENAGAVFRTSERFLGAIKQYLCLSLLKNSASPLMIVFQLSCSIFMSLVSRFRSGLKAEIGVFFPMIILRVLENVAQPNFQQKMIVLHFLEKLRVDSQILVDVFTNYDCDANSSNIFERIVTGLLKTAQGASPGIAATLLPPQEASMKLEAMKCLVEILKSMGDWMNKQLQIPDPQSTQKIDAFEDSIDGRTDVPVGNGNTETSEGLESKSDAASGASDAASIEQRQDYKLELEEGISLFNCNPKGGVDFLIAAKKVGKFPDEIATFLRNTSGLNKTFIGDYLGEGEEMSLKVMHAYVDSFNFQGMDFDHAIRLFFQDLALPGEEQKIDRIMEKFAEHYCKCNPKVFSSADTAYVLVYSVIMLNTDAHNSMVKNKMTADDFIRNNHGIDGGRDLPEEYMRTLYGRILKNEIKMKEDGLTPQHNHSTNYPKIPGVDNILNIVIQKREDKCTTSDDLIWPMQQFKEKACKSESAYYPATDVGILRFMIEVCWAPMLAAFSVPLDQSDDEVVISLCLAGFHHAIHVTAVMCMKTHRDAFVTSLAKFTSLHSAADMKQKNIDAIKEIVTVAVEDGNYLQEAWEHILTCISRFEHLHLLGEGVPPDAAFALPQINTPKSKQMKSSILPVLKKKGYRQFQHPASGVRRGSYDCAGAGGRASGLVTSEQVNKLVSNLNMLEQIGPSEVNQIFTRSQKLNSEAVIAFVRALCKVSMEELQSTSDPRVFSLTKIVEIAYYNMNRIRLVWSSMWHVLTGFFVTIGCSENLSIAIFAMDSLHQISMKFLEREELPNYNFQNEFMKPFVIVMRKSKAVEIRELIIRCIFQMIWTHVKYVKSGWKSMFMVFSTASYDEHKYIVLLAFEIIEKIVRDYFPFLTETDTTTFTDFVNCLIAFTNTKFNEDISLNALALFQFCALKLADEEVKKTTRNKDKEGSRKIIQSSHAENNGKPVCPQLSDKGQHLYFWFPLLAGLSELTFDLRPEVRKGAMEILFDTLRYHGHLFSLPLWERVFDSVLFPIFDYFCHAIDPSGGYVQGFENHVNEDQDAWLYETCTLALQLVIDLFVKFYDTVNPLLRRLLTLLTSFISRPHQNLAGIGIAAFVHLVSNAGSLFSEEKWPEVVSSLKEAAIATLPDFSQIENLSSDVTMLNTENDAAEYQRSRMLYFAISDAKCRSSVQLLLIQAVMEIYNIHRPQLSMRNTLILFQALNAVATHAQEINSDNHLRSRLQDLRSMTQMQDPPLLRLENESFQICLTLLRNGITDQPSNDEEVEVEEHLVNLCREVIQFYLNTAKSSFHAGPDSSAQPANLWLIPLGSTKRRELASRAPLIVATIQAICGLGVSSFQKNLAHFFPLITGLINCEHGSNEVQVALSNMLGTCVGPALHCSC